MSRPRWAGRRVASPGVEKNVSQWGASTGGGAYYSVYYYLTIVLAIQQHKETAKGSPFTHPAFRPQTSLLLLLNPHPLHKTRALWRLHLPCHRHTQHHLLGKSSAHTPSSDISRSKLQGILEHHTCCHSHTDRTQRHICTHSLVFVTSESSCRNTCAIFVSRNLPLPVTVTTP